MTQTPFDPRNSALWVHVGGRLVERADAKVSVFDSSVQGGDACWEGCGSTTGGCSRNLLNNILAKIEANRVGADDAIGPLTRRVQELFAERTAREGRVIPS